jgi:hypothetical protein
MVRVPTQKGEASSVNKYKEDKESKSSRKGQEIFVEYPAIEKKNLAKSIGFGKIIHFGLW